MGATDMQAAFNGKRLLEEISEMQAHQQLAFAAACCERMLPSYDIFVQETAWGNARPIRSALDVIWGACEGEHPEGTKVQDALTQCEQCAPDSDDFESLYTSLAQDTAFSICALLEFILDCNPSHIVRVPRFSTDSIDLIVQEHENMDPRDSFREQRILEHPLMQQELARQQRDLAQAKAIVLGDKAAVLSMRTNARAESILTIAN